MLCTKCGQEYEGSQCPRCDGPVILVNNSDYLARRKAYEEKQALKERSASSDKKEESQSDYGQALAKRVQAIKKQSQNRSKADSRKQNVGKAGGAKKQVHTGSVCTCFGFYSAAGVLGAALPGVVDLLRPRPPRWRRRWPSARFSPFGAAPSAGLGGCALARLRSAFSPAGLSPGLRAPDLRLG